LGAANSYRQEFLGGDGAFLAEGTAPGLTTEQVARRGRAAATEPFRLRRPAVRNGSEAVKLLKKSDFFARK
jgi:hypothetical protein